MSFLQIFPTIPDPRVQRTRPQDLKSLLAMALCSTVTVTDNLVGVAEFVQTRHSLFTQFLNIFSGVASDDTFTHVFWMLDAQQLESTCLP